jgi:hypothetical protein
MPWRIATAVSIEGVDGPLCPRFEMEAYFRRIPKNIRSFEESSGGFSVAGGAALGDDSEVDEGAVEAGDTSKDPDDVDAIMDGIKEECIKKSMRQCRTNTDSVPVLSCPVLSRSIKVGCTRNGREVCDWDGP